MKALSVLSLLCVSLFLSLSAGAQSFVWPMAGHDAGDNIISRPQSSIGDESNMSSLFLGGDEGDVVVSPADGVILHVSVGYSSSLTYMTSYDFDSRLSLDQNIANTDADKSFNRKYLNCDVTIRIADGRKIHLGGIRGDRHFKTGQRISAGDTLGLLSYSYKSIKQPSLSIELSDAYNSVCDPMTPFGLATTFVAPGEFKREDPLSVDKIHEDLDVLRDAIVELYPSLDFHMSDSAFIAIVDSLKSTVTSPIDPCYDMRSIIRRLLSYIPDSHMALDYDYYAGKTGPSWKSATYLSFCDDTLRVIAADPEYQNYIGRVVTHVDDVPAVDYVNGYAWRISEYDEKVQSRVYEEFVMFSRYIMSRRGTKNDSQKLTFDDGTSLVVPFTRSIGFPYNDNLRRVLKWLQINSPRDDNDEFEVKTLNDSASYLALRTFDMMEASVDQIRSFLDTCRTPNLIIDVRNNYGGRSEVLNSILSCLTDKPMDRQKGGFLRANKIGKYASLKYCVNFDDQMDFYEDYTPRADGCYLYDTIQTSSVIMPDTSVYYGGRVYVLTNGKSISAATIFPSVLVRNRRAVTVGRETCSGYHRITAMDKAQIRLPNSLQTVYVPMIHICFDTTVCDRTPDGRGLLPDYPLPLTYNELMGGSDGEADVMLQYALSLIADGKYLSETDPFEPYDVVPAESSCPFALCFIPFAVAIIVVVVLLLCRRRKNR